MGKKTSKSTEKKSSKTKESLDKTEEMEAVEEEKQTTEEQLYESDLVKLKKENAKLMKKHVKKVEAEVKQTFDLKQAVLAVKALQKYQKSKAKAKGQKTNLLQEEDPFLHLQFSLTQLPKGSPTPRPLQLKVSSPFNNVDFNTRVCVFVKDPESEFRSQIQDLDIPCVAEVIGLDRLRRDFREFQDKRKLMGDFDIFLADIRVYKMLPQCLGREFYQKKVFPCPIKLHGFDSPKELQKQLNEAS
mmetsp:Transcript_4650/g.7888  ORF Transcript_4650/g.7888 Transcript_4650/m.7888 type:complete len:244 (+) Transcript_4650:46-777(+)